LPVHEVESLYCLPSVVAAVAQHLGKSASFNTASYVARIQSSISVTERHKVVIERWKLRVEGPLLGLIGDVASRTADLDATLADIPRVFTASEWGFSPHEILVDEKTLIEAAVPNGTIEEILEYMPGKSLISLAGLAVGLSKDDYRNLVNAALAGTDGLGQLGEQLDAALAPMLPPRFAPPSRHAPIEP